MIAQSSLTWPFGVSKSQMADLEELQTQVKRFQAGATSEGEFRAFRVPMGVYEQRESTYMLRVRLTTGALSPKQMHVLAAVARSFGNGILHVTTRQDIQVHGVPLELIRAALVAIHDCGLSTRGGGGNTVRNVTTCADAGVCSKERFDVRPYSVALTHRLLADPLSMELPRKYKIAVSGCDSDCSAAAVNDLGFVACEKNGEAGFAVYVGGGMGNKSRVGDLLHDFIPGEEAILVAEAIKRVFDRHGDRRNKNRARLRFLVSRLGFEQFRNLYEAESGKLRAAAWPMLKLRPMPEYHRLQLSEEPPRTTDSLEYPEWRKFNTSPQKQTGFHVAILPLELGDIDSSTLAYLADIVEEHGDGFVYASQTQNLVLRWLRESELPTLHGQLARLRLASPEPPVLRDLVACAGASTCRLGLCQSRGLASALVAHLRASDVNLDSLGRIRVNISGCPNACGRHPVADIGLFGAARRFANGLVPHYSFQLGGRVAEGVTELGVVVGTVAAKSIPAFVADLIGAWQSTGDRQTFPEFLRGGGRAIAKDLSAIYATKALSKPDASLFYDWEADRVFSLAGRGAAECGAGVFDLIEVDLRNAREAVAEGRFYSATVLAARALLVTRGAQPKDDANALQLFQEQFVEQGLVASGYASVIEAAARCVNDPNAEEAFSGSTADIDALITEVSQLYRKMDASLRFVTPDRQSDFANPPDRLS